MPLLVLNDLLTVIAAEQRAAGESVEAGASAADLAQAKVAVESQLNLRLPDSYADVLSLRNGIAFNGVVFYSATDTSEHPSAGGFWQGLVAANEVWRDDARFADRLVIGDSDMEIFVYEKESNRFTRRDRVSDDIIGIYVDAPTLIDDVLRQRR